MEGTGGREGEEEDAGNKSMGGEGGREEKRKKRGCG